MFRLLALCILLQCSAGQISNRSSIIISKNTSPSFATEGFWNSGYLVRLKSPPLAPVTITLSSPDKSTISKQRSVVLNQSNWATGQEFVLQPVRDYLLLDSPYDMPLSLSAQSNDARFNFKNGTSVDFIYAVANSDIASIVVAQSTSFPFPKRIVEGRYSDFMLTLSSRPQQAVNVSLYSDSHVSLVPASMYFTPQAWNISQSLRVYCIHDGIVNSAPALVSILNMDLSSSDYKFNGTSAKPFTLLLDDVDQDNSLFGAAVSWSSTQVGSRFATVEFLIEISGSNANFASRFVGLDTIVYPSLFEFGDGTQSLIQNFTFVEKLSSSSLWYAYARVEHQYALSRTAVSSFTAYLEQCCRSPSYNNNPTTKRRLKLAVNIPNAPYFGLSFSNAASYSPIIASVPNYNVPSNAVSELKIFATAGDHPMLFRLGTSRDYGYIDCSVPPGMTIDEVTGIVSWNTRGLTSGLWNTLILVKDLLTLNEISAELTFSIAPAGSIFVDLITPVNLSAITYVGPGDTIALDFSMNMGTNLTVGSLLNAISVDNNNVALVSMGVSEMGPNIVCFSTIPLTWNVYSTSPKCNIIMVGIWPVAPSLNFVSSNLTFQKYLDTNQLTLFPNAVLSMPTVAWNGAISRLFVQLSGVEDKAYEVITSSMPTWMPVKILQISPHVILFEGLSGKSVYEFALQSISYTNEAVRPTPGLRTIEAFISMSSQLFRVYKAQVQVTVAYTPSIIDLDTASSGYDFATTFVPLGPSVHISNFVKVNNRDGDILGSDVIITNCLDASAESLAVTLPPPPPLQRPIQVSSGPLLQMFGASVSQQQVNHIISVNESFQISRVDVIVYINHSFVGNLLVQLQHLGLTETLAVSPGGRDCSADNLVGTIFSPLAPKSNILSPTDSESPIFCNYETRGIFLPTGNLSNFNVLPSQGDWTLGVADLSVDDDVGVLLSWAIVLYPQSDLSAYASSESYSLKRTSVDTNSYQIVSDIYGQAQDIQIAVQLQVDSLSDTEIMLTHPDGTNMPLLSSADCSRKVGSYLLFTSLSTTNLSDPVSNVCADRQQYEVIQTFKPSTPFNSILMKRIAGSWTLSARSLSAQNAVNILGWQIQFSVAPNVRSNFDSTSCSMYLRGIDSGSHYASVIQSIVYQDSVITPNTTLRVVSIRTFDNYSTSNESVSFVSIQHMNVVPLLSIQENDYTSFGKWNSINRIVRLAVPPEAGLDKFNFSKSGIAIFQTDEANGRWEYSTNAGTSFSPVGTVSFEAALLLSSINTSLIRFVPNTYFHEVALFRFVVWESSTFLSGTSGVNISAYPVATGPFSVAQSTAIVTVEFVNNRPSILPGSQLQNISEDNFDNSGTLVSTIVANTFLDPDRATPSGFNFSVGVAVVEVDRRFGDWLYKCSNTPFQSFIGGVLENGQIFPVGPTPQKATLLADTCFIKFLPNYNFNSERYVNGSKRSEWTMPFIKIRAWDQTQGFSGQITVNTSTGEVNGAYSLNFEMATISVLDVDKLPVLSIGGISDNYSVTFSQNHGAIYLVNPHGLMVTDEDNATLVSATIFQPVCYDQGFEEIGFNVSGTGLIATTTSNQSILISFVNASESWALSINFLEIYSSIKILITSDSPAPLHAYQSVLRCLSYENHVNVPNNATRRVDVTLFDGALNGITRTIDLQTFIYDAFAPVLSLNAYVFTFFAHQNTLPITLSNLTLTDLDNNDYFFMQSATVKQTSAEYRAGTDSLFINTTTSISSYYNTTSGTLILTGSAAVSEYQRVLQTVTFQNLEEEPAPYSRHFEFNVFDTRHISVSQNIVVDMRLVNAHAPLIQNLNSIVLLENTDTFFSVGQQLNITDSDSGNFPVINATIVILNRQSDQFEYISATSFGQVSVSSQAGLANRSSFLLFSGKLLENMTEDMGSGMLGSGEGEEVVPAFLTDFVRSMQSTVYYNTMIEPSSAVRTIRFTVFDGMFYSSFDMNVSWVLNNDPPQLHDFEWNSQYVEGSAGVALFNNPLSNLSDSDSLTMAFAVATLLSSPDGTHDVLTLPQQFSQLGISWNFSNLVLNISGYASVQDYTSILKNISYYNSNAFPGNPIPGPRLVSLYISDGLNFSNTITSSVVLVTKNDAPIISVLNSNENATHSVQYVENTLYSLLASNDTVVTDVDSVILYDLVVQILNVYDYSSENLGLLAGVPLGMTVLPSDAICKRACRNFTLSPSPFEYLTASGFQGSSESECASLCSDGISLVTNSSASCDTLCAASNASAKCNISCTLGHLSQTTLWVVGGAAATEFVQIMKSVYYNNTSDEPIYATRFISFSVGDGQLFSTASFTQVTMIPVNNPPVLHLWAQDSVAFSTSFTEKGSPVFITNSTLLVSDVDNLNLNYFEVILLNPVDGEYEGLYLIDEAATNGAFSSPTVYDRLFQDSFGLLQGQDHYPLRHNFTLSGVQSLSSYSNTLKKLVYVNTHHNLTFPVVRNISFRAVDEGNLTSSISYALITLIPVNDPPMVNYSSAVRSLSFLEDDPMASFAVLKDYFDPEERPFIFLPELNNSGVQLVDQAPFGVASVDSLGLVNYSPALWDYGNRSFSYKVCDSLGLCSVSLNVSVYIAHFNHAPMASRPLIYNISENTVNQINLDWFFFDVEDFQLEPFKSRLDAPSLLTVVLPAKQPSTVGMLRVSLRGHLLVFEPRVNFVGNSTVQYDVCDSEALCTTFHLTISINHVNNLPQVASTIRFLLLQNTNLSATFFATDVEDSACPYNFAQKNLCTPLNISIISFPMFGNISLQSFNSTAGGLVTILYQPAFDYSGNDTAMIVTCDSEGGCVNTSITFTVQFVLYPPFATISEVGMTEETTLYLDLMSIIHDGANLVTPQNISILSPPQHGTSIFNRSTGIFTFQPFVAYFGTDLLVFRACNSPTSCVNASISIIVNFLNHVPVTQPVNISLWENTLVSFNISNFATDQEDGRWPRLNFSIFSKASKGVVLYDASTGNFTYKPNQFLWGKDYFLYQACDMLMNCTLGQVFVDILPVNNPPMLRDSFYNNTPYVVDEDTYNLVLVYALHTDPDLPIQDANSILNQEVIKPDLLVTIISPAKHGTLTVFAQYGIVSYLPESNFVGNDSFSYRVCDKCSSTRNVEFGRLTSNSDAACARERAIQSVVAARGCLNVTVPLRVVNINDSPVPAPLAAVVQNSSYLFDPFAHVFDQDDLQKQILLNQDKSLSTFRLRNISDIDYTSLQIISQPSNGSATVSIRPNSLVFGIFYQPTTNFSGYDKFVYSICDLDQSCTEAEVVVLVPAASPKLLSITAHGACGLGGVLQVTDLFNVSCTGLVDTDSGLSPYDHIALTFDSPTNMPPIGAINTVFPQADVDKLLQFSKPITRSSSVAFQQLYFGFWSSSTVLNVRIADPGYPQPRLSSLSISLQSANAYNCESFNKTNPVKQGFGPRDQSPFCLTNADKTSLNTVSSTIGPLQGDWGLRLPVVQGIDLRQPASVEPSYFGIGSSLYVYVSPAISAADMATICSAGPSSVFGLSVFGDDVSVDMSCFNVLPDDSPVTTSMDNATFNCFFAFETLSIAEKLACNQSDMSRSRRAVAAVNTLTAQATAFPDRSAFLLEFLNMSYTDLNPTDTAAFFQAVVMAWDLDRVSRMISFGTSFSAYAAYSRNTAASVAAKYNASNFYIMGALSETPLVYSVQASVDTTAQTRFLSFTFTSDTNVPSVATDYRLTQSDVNMLFTFAPTIGTAYSGQWRSARELLITITNPNRNMTSPKNLTVTFSPNKLFDGRASSNPCRGSQVCGVSSASWGICNKLQTSCRSYGSVYGNGISGSWDLNAATSSTASASSSNSSLLALIVIPIVLLIIIVLIVYRYKKRSRQSVELKRVVRAWKSKFKDDKKDAPFGDSAEVWSRPPAMVAMRANPDPFLNMAEASATDSFAPRAPATLSPRRDSRDDLSPSLPPLKGVRMPLGSPLSPLARLPPLLADPSILATPAAAAQQPTSPSDSPVPLLSSAAQPLPATRAPGIPVFPRRPSRDLFAANMGLKRPSDPQRSLPPMPAMPSMPTFGSRPALVRAMPPGSETAPSPSIATMPLPPRSMPSTRVDPFAAAVPRLSTDPFAKPGMPGPAPIARRSSGTFAQMPQRPSRSSIPEVKPEQPPTPQP